MGLRGGRGGPAILFTGFLRLARSVDAARHSCHWLGAWVESKSVLAEGLAAIEAHTPIDTLRLPVPPLPRFTVTFVHASSDPPKDKEDRQRWRQRLNPNAKAKAKAKAKANPGLRETVHW